MAQEVEIGRLLIPSPRIDNPNRKVWQIEYKAGELPPHFIYIDEADWTAEEEKKRITADIKKRLEKKREIISI